VGDGSLRGQLETMAKDNVLFVGTVSHEDLPKYMAISNIFVRPSISEGLGTAFLEAMAAGLPIVGTNVGGIPDFLKDSQTGLFCTTESKSIAEKINLLLKDNDLRNRISENARKLVSEKYQWDNIAEEYKKLYLEL
jgi:glycosyltransferase involved in cell wall biosynthesis